VTAACGASGTLAIAKEASAASADCCQGRTHPPGAVASWRRSSAPPPPTATRPSPPTCNHTQPSSVDSRSDQSGLVSGRQPRIRDTGVRIASKRGELFRDALAASGGTLAICWYSSATRGATRPRGRRPRTEVATPGKAKLTLRLTATGRALVRGHRRLKILATVTFAARAAHRAPTQTRPRSDKHLHTACLACIIAQARRTMRRRIVGPAEVKVRGRR
jgi:hypothetical protein